MTTAREIAFDTALFAALPAASNVLALGEGGEHLHARYAAAHPQAAWTQRPAASGTLDSLGSDARYDLVVVTDPLETLSSPRALLKSLREYRAAEACVYLGLHCGERGALIERILYGETIADKAVSSRDAFKMLLDCGWLPDAIDATEVQHPNRRFARLLVDAAEALDVSKGEAELELWTQRMIFRCTRAERPIAGPASVAVVTRCTNERVLANNLSSSPGIRELDVEPIVLRGFQSAAGALRAALDRTQARWLLVFDEDVYVPEGTGTAIAGALERATGAPVVGFAGVERDADGTARRAGVVVDERTLYDYPVARGAVSVLDGAVALDRDVVAAIDSSLHWDLWATDLCLQSVARGANPVVARAPLFLTAARPVGERLMFAASVLGAKYPAMDEIPTWRARVARGRIEKVRFAG